MQKYKEINGNDYVKNSRTTINETMQSIQSMNSGTAFPTNNLFEGMKCYRTDLKKTYTLTDVENNTWVEDAHATLSDEATHAASATKLQTARSLNLGGAVTADAATFDGTADATINVKTLDASKLKGTAPVSTTGNAATASKLAIPRTLSLTGKAAGSTSFDGSANASINVTSVNADTATKLSTARKINITGNATGAATFDGSADANISVTVNESKHAAAADKATTATKVNATVPNGGTADLVFGIMANDDSARIRIGGSNDNGWLEIATSDNGNEPIYARQYSGSFGQDGAKTVTNEAVLLDGSGNTKFPHDVTAANFVGHLAGSADSATNADKVDGYHASDLLKKIAEVNTVGIVAASLTENGYVKFANGLILQWGNASGYDNDEKDNHSTFPIAFSSTCFVVLLTSRKYMVANRLYNQSKTGFTWTSQSGLISWAALGM